MPSNPLPERAPAEARRLTELANDWLDHATAKKPGWGNQPAVPIALVQALLQQVETLHRAVEEGQRASDPLPAARDLETLIQQWRHEAAFKDSLHATMGIGWKVCADELEAALSRLARSPQVCRHGNDREQCTDEACYLASRARSPQPEGWQRIETVPKDGTAVLLWEERSKCATVGYWCDRYTEKFHALIHGDEAPWNDYDPAPIFEATHWMPLPPAPETTP